MSAERSGRYGSGRAGGGRAAAHGLGGLSSLGGVPRAWRARRDPRAGCGLEGSGGRARVLGARWRWRWRGRVWERGGRISSRGGGHLTRCSA